MSKFTDKDFEVGKIYLLNYRDIKRIYCRRIASIGSSRMLFTNSKNIRFTTIVRAIKLPLILELFVTKEELGEE